MDRNPTLLDLLEKIEDELKQLGRWELDSRNIDPENSAPFGGKQLAFEQWLQHIFLPNARKAIKTGAGPTESNVGIAAIRNLDGDDQAERLVSLLCEFDAKYASKSLHT